MDEKKIDGSPVSITVICQLNNKQREDDKMRGAGCGGEAGATRILLMATAVNSLTQRVYVDLKDSGYDVRLASVDDEGQMQASFRSVAPDLVIAPYLKRAIPPSIWSECPCFILHPGIKGDRGPSSLDWAILNGEDRWGVTVLQANADFDAGDIWAHREYSMRNSSKSKLYRHEVPDAAVEALQEALERYRGGTYVPEALDYRRPDVKGQLRPPMKQEDRAVDWSAPTNIVLRKLRCSDTYPGVLDTLYGERWVF